MDEYNAAYRAAYDASMADIATDTANGVPPTKGDCWNAARVFDDATRAAPQCSAERGMWSGRHDAWWHTARTAKWSRYE